jgi:hypothetical protein
MTRASTPRRDPIAPLTWDDTLDTWLSLSALHGEVGFPYVPKVLRMEL